MKGFLERLQWKLSGMMQGRRGADTFSNFLVVAGIVLLFASLIPGLDLLSWVALIVLAYSLFRSYSKNIAARDRENATFERIVEKPRKQLSLMRKKWTNRKTTRYFKCKGCGQVLSVPRGKGTLRVVCRSARPRRSRSRKGPPWISQLSSASCSPSPTTCRRYCTIR